MFNLFKNKVELKNENCIMSSIDNKRGLKIGSEINVSANFVCLIFHKNKRFNVLSSGKYKLSQTTFGALFESQQKPKRKLKYISFIAHYVNISPQKIEFAYKKHKHLFEFSINDPEKFVNLILLYTYKTDNNYTYSYLCDIFKEIVIHSKSNNKEISKDTLIKYGIEILKTSKHLLKSQNTSSENNLSIFNKPSQSSKYQNTSTNSNTKTSISSKTNIQNNNSNTPTTTVNSLEPVYPHRTECSKCGNKIKFKTTYCIKCGNKLIK